MADHNFKTVLVKDATIGDITPDLTYAVQSGGAQCTYQAFPSTSNSNSAIIFNCTVPSESVVMGRDVLLQSGLTFRLNISGVPVGDLAFQYGLSDSFAAFPLNALFSTATCQINNTTVSVNLQDIMPSLLRLNNSRELYRYNSTTASFPDQAWGEYRAAVDSNSNPMASYNNAGYDLDQVPRGAVPCVIGVVHQPYGAAVDASLISTDVRDTWVVTVQAVVCEPLFLSPFIYSDPEYNAQGLVGVSQLSLTLNVDTSCSRLWSSAGYSVAAGVKTSYITSIQPGSATNPLLFTAGQVGTQASPSAPTLLLRFLSTQPTDLIQPKNVCPYMDMPRFITSQGNAGQAMAQGVSRTITSSNIQLNQIPDLLIINIRKPMALQRWSDANAFFQVNGISINFNNSSGLLSSASAYDLWRMSQRNGSTQSWAEFSGQQSVNGISVAGEPTVSSVATTGSLLIINPAYDLSLPAYLSNGSLGNYNLQFQVSVTNQFSETITPEMIVICANSGILVTSMGTSAAYTGILTKEMVLSAKESSEHVSSKAHERMVGGKFLNRLLTAAIGRRHERRAMVKEMAPKMKSKLSALM